LCAQFPIFESRFKKRLFSYYLFIVHFFNTLILSEEDLYFEDFGLDDRLLDGLYSMGYEKPTPIQEQAIPLIMEGRDLIACAQTGTGKTAAFLLPIMHKIMQDPQRKVNTLVLAPTRELALQIDQQIEGLSYFAGVNSIAVYGGGTGALWDQQKKALKEGVDIIIATPGRLIAQLTAGDIDLTQLKHFVLDEADRMLDMGFHDDIIRILSYLPAKRQTLLFSATMPPKIRALASKLLVEPASVTIAISKPAEGILQQFYHVYEAQKIPLLRHILADDAFQSVIIFASTKEKVKSLDFDLRRAKYSVKAFHSDLEQDEREKILREFKNRQVRILVGTDILSRGIDVDGISLVVNFDAPPDPEDYVHRIGRTARAERTGTAVTMINEKDFHKQQRIERLIGKQFEQIPLPASVGEGPVLKAKPKTSGPAAVDSNQPKKKKPWKRKKPSAGSSGGNR
jgi:superfamily II DNA/RNA helicase